MGTYTGKVCSRCNALAFKCKCGANSNVVAVKPPPRSFMRPTVQQAPKVAEPAVQPPPESPVTVELAKVSMDQIPGEPPADNKGGRLNAYLKGRREVFSFFVSKLTSSPPAP